MESRQREPNVPKTPTRNQGNFPLGSAVSMTPIIYSPQQIAELLGVSRETVLRKCREGKWPHRRLTAQTIVFTDEDLNTLLDASREGNLARARQP
jgi:excisionase family DNA binding protein